MLVITVKYLTFVMRASNDGEGGILALVGPHPRQARPPRAHARHPLRRGAALRRRRRHAGHLGAQRRRRPEGGRAVAREVDRAHHHARSSSRSSWCSGAAREGIGVVFGPVMVVWFLAIGALGARQIVGTPIVLVRDEPASRGALLLSSSGWRRSPSLGAVILCIAGGEALYADMGHFGRRPIALAWYGARAARARPQRTSAKARFCSAAARPSPRAFYAIVPQPLLMPMIVLSAAATVIASQALISGAYSLTQQAVQLGYRPRVTVVHTSRRALRADLRSRGQLGADGRVRRARRDVRIVGQARRGVRARGHRHDERHDARVLPGASRRRGGGRSARPCRSACSSGRRPDVPRREPPQVRRRRLGAVRHGARRSSSLFTTWMAGRRRLAAHLARVMLPLDDVPRGRRPHASRRASRHGGLPDRQRGRRADPALAPLQAQPGAAREGRALDDHERPDAVRQARRPHRARRRSTTASTAWSRASGTWRRRTCPDLLAPRAAPVSPSISPARPTTSAARRSSPARPAA